jgi:hypothetical protein
MEHKKLWIRWRHINLPSASSSFHGGCLELCFWEQTTSSLGALLRWHGAACSVPPTRLDGCRAPAPLLHYGIGFYSLRCPKWLFPDGGAATVCAESPSAVRWTPEGPDRVLRFLQGPFYTFTGLGYISPLSEGLPCNCSLTLI